MLCQANGLRQKMKTKEEEECKIKNETSIPPSCSGNRRPQTKRTFYTLDESWSHGIIILRYTMISNQYVELVNSINIMSHRTHF